ncbi:hypothetical protein HJC23_008963 [Cyclotella cryptica]|uniref:Expansin-like EG45 domain-containing protein n=1 Tax=Cyclotella cryptica TaxID=29204 RepID=A0ABD3NWC1_9STRA
MPMGPRGTGASSTCDGQVQGGDWCNKNQGNCEAGCGGRWCSKTSGGGSVGGEDSKCTGCSWDNGSNCPDQWCNGSQSNCKVCTGTWFGGGSKCTGCSWDNGVNCPDQWCNGSQSNCNVCTGTWFGGGGEPPAPTPKSPENPPTPTPGSTPGELTMWSDNPSAVIGGSCEYAQKISTAKSGAWLSPYITSGNYCAVSEDLFQGGAACGRCYSITYDGSSATNPGKAGNAVVQVVNSGAGGSNHFDCFIDGFHTITSASTGIFPVKFSHVACQGITPPTAVILDGNNAWYVKVLFSGGTTGVASAKIHIGGASFSMSRLSGATFSANTNGAWGQASFEVTFDNGSAVAIDGCFGGAWPVPTSSVCV